MSHTRNLTIYKSAHSIQTYNHQIFTVCQNKNTLLAFDDKRFILEDVISTLPHGHFRISDLQQQQINHN